MIIKPQSNTTTQNNQTDQIKSENEISIINYPNQIKYESDNKELSEVIKASLLKEISDINEKKKSFLYKFILNCYDFSSEIEDKLEEEKNVLTEIVDFSLNNEKLDHRDKIYQISKNLIK